MTRGGFAVIGVVGAAAAVIGLWAGPAGGGADRKGLSIYWIEEEPS